MKTPSGVASSVHKIYRKTPRYNRNAAMAYTSTTNTNTSNANTNKMVVPDKIVYGKIYANWCGACQNLAPEWDKLVSSIGAAAIEFSVEDNEQPEKRKIFAEKYKSQLPPVEGFPTIYRLKQPRGAIELYNGPRTVADMKKWVLS